MTRKESEKDSERTHYYSQFWLDVAAGRKIIGAPKANDEIDTYEQELEPATISLGGIAVQLSLTITKKPLHTLRSNLNSMPTSTQNLNSMIWTWKTK